MLGAVPTVDPQAVGRLRDADGLGGRAPPAQGAGQRRDAAGRAHRAPVRRRGHRALPHRAHVLRRSAPGRDARDDPGRRCRRPARSAGQDPADAARRTSSSCSRSWPGCRSRSACSTRRCTSSCRTSRRRSRRSPRRPGSMPRRLQRRASELREANPMLGLRGCRLGVLFPEIYEMQARAIFEAALAVARELGRDRGAGDHGAAGRHGARARADQGARSTRSPRTSWPSAARAVTYQVGTMIEVPRAALRAAEIAGHASSSASAPTTSPR